MRQRTISILGMGWLGLPLGVRLCEVGYKVRGSTTRHEKLEEIRKVGAIPHLIQVGPEVAVNEHEAFFNCDVLIITLPPSSLAKKTGGSGRNTKEGPDGLFSDAIQKILTNKEVGPSHVVYTSSTSVYGEQVGKVDEETATDPVTRSAKTVVEVEKIIRMNHPSSSTILRLGGLVGGKRNPGKFLAGRTGLPNGNAPINLVHREDCIRAIAEIIDQNAWGYTFNLVAEEHPLKKKYYPKMALRTGLVPPQFDPSDLKQGKSVLSKKIEKMLGFTFRYPDPLTFPE